MGTRILQIWKWLPFIGLGLLLIKDFAPISDPLSEILFAMAIAVILAFSGIYFWQERRARHADQSSSAAIPPTTRRNR